MHTQKNYCIRPYMTTALLVYIILLCGLSTGNYAGENTFVTFSKSKENFTLSDSESTPPIVVHTEDYKGITRVAGYFKSDLMQVTGINHPTPTGNYQNNKEIVLIGSLDKNPLIKELVSSGKLKVSDISGTWENSLIAVINKPFTGVERALVLTGSDKRGVMYSVFEISRQMGVSPWYWWADVPAKKHSGIYIKTGRYVLGEPKVKYRGIFLNDEEPALGRWATKFYG